MTKTYVTDPARPTVLVNVQFEALKPGAYHLFALYDPSLAGDAGNDSGTTSGTTSGSALLASDTHSTAATIGSALVSSLPFTAISSGYVGTSDGKTDLVAHHTLTRPTSPRARATSHRSDGSRRQVLTHRSTC